MFLFGVENGYGKGDHTFSELNPCSQTGLISPASADIAHSVTPTANK